MVPQRLSRMSKKTHNIPHKHVRSHTKRGKFQHMALSIFWFLFGFGFTGIMLVSFTLFIFQINHTGRIYPGIFIDGIHIGEKTTKEAELFFEEKNIPIKNSKFYFTYDNQQATSSASDLNIGYNSKLLADQAYSLGRSNNLFSNLTIILNSYLNGTVLFSSYTFSDEKLKDIVKPFYSSIHKEAQDALFTVQKNRVIAFSQSEDGITIDYDKLQEEVESKIPSLIHSKKPQEVFISIPVKILKPTVTTDKANNLGIVEVIGTGKSTFHHSIPNRIYNISLATARINGLLIAPNETFSFNQALGDVSKFTGYKEAYIIKSGRTVLGDGGGVCQVSTTLFRALLDAGVPIAERNAHAYRVSYYEQDSQPGLDATVYSPTYDLKFKNDTGAHILIQGTADINNTTLMFTLYGKRDGREVVITKPVIKNQTPPPDPLYQDDPELPRGVEKQVDFAASGANVYFERTVKKDNKIYISDKFSSNYRPWQAVYLRGTKEN